MGKANTQAMIAKLIYQFSKSPADTSVILDVRQGDAHIKRPSSIAMVGVNRQSDHGNYAVSLSVKVRTWQSIDWLQHGAG